jgi:hypothetical protein
MTHVNRGLFTSASQHWATPEKAYQDLNAEFHFDYDPCPLKSDRDLKLETWGKRVFLNPPYGRETETWLRLAYNHSRKGNLVVCLIASRTDTKWWHEIVMKADEIRFLRGRLRFNGSKINAPFPSAVVVFGKAV